MTFKYFLRNIWIVLLLLYFGFPIETKAQLKTKLKHYSTEDGLSHDGVLCITRDKEGFMWFGTWDGINRFDGNSFITYKARPGDRSVLKNNKIRNIVEDKPGFLWVKTYDSKVFRFDKRSERFFEVKKTASQEIIEDLVVDRMVPTNSMDTWLITENKGLLCALYKESVDPQIIEFRKHKTGSFHLPSDKVNFLREDRAKRVWIGTSSGIIVLKKNKQAYHQYLNFRSKKQVFGENYSFTAFAENNNHIYLGTQQGELIIYDTNKRTFRKKTIAKNIAINAIKVSKSGLVYITTSGKGLAVLNPERLELSFKEMPGHSTFLAMYEDNSGNIWLEPKITGIVRYNYAKQSFQFYDHKKEENSVAQFSTKISQDRYFSVFEDVNGVLWISLKGGGFGYYHEATDKINYFYNEPELPNQQLSNVVISSFSDSTGVLWLSTKLGGIHKASFPVNNFNHKNFSPNSSNRLENEVRAIYEDKKGRLWVATKIGRLYVYENGKIINNILLNISTADLGSVYTIKETRDGRIWLGTKGQGLIVLKPTGPERLQYHVTRHLMSSSDPYTLNSNMIYSVLEDKSGRIWIGTFGGGLNLVDERNGKLRFKNAANTFKNYPINTCNVIRYLEQDMYGIIWIATTDGLLRFNPDQQKQEDYRFHRTLKIPGDALSLGNNDVQFIHKQDNGAMWLGTFGGGLNKVTGKPKLNDKLRFEIFTREDGLPNDIVLSIVDDKRGNLWLATENGLSKFNINHKTFRNYDSYDGLPRSGFSEAASFRAKSGELFFGCIDGYMYFYPDKIISKKFNAKMALTNLQLFNNDVIAGETGSPLAYSINNTERIELSHDQDVLSIDYSVLDFRSNHNISYAYILEGFDKDWHFVKNQRKATYTKLPPGEYVFKVKSANNDLFANVPQKQIIVKILPPWWKTIWAYFGYLILIFICAEIARRVIITMIRLRNTVVVEHRLTELKLQFFTNISHELRTPLTLIVNPLKQISETEQLSAKGQQYLEVVNKNANRMVRFINQLLDFRKVQSGKMQLKVTETEMVAFVKDIAAYFTEIANEKNISLIMDVKIDQAFLWIDVEKLDIVLYNILSNAFKFTYSGKKIVVAVEKIDDYLNIGIRDEGIGVMESKLSEIFELYYEGDHDHAQKGTGIGLALSKEIIQAHHGKITANNNADQGMTFLVQLKLGKAHFTKEELEGSKAERTSFLPEVIDNNKVNTSAITAEPLNDDKPLILLVEDNTDLRRFLADQFLGLYRVEEAVDGQEGLRKAEKLIPDIIISDVMMPNMDGIEMLDKLKNSELTSHIPVILLTAKSSVENQIKGLQYGADFYITKPFHTDYIVASVKSLLKQRKKLLESYIDNRKVLKLEPKEIIITSKDEKFLKELIEVVEKQMVDPQFNIDSVAEAIGMGRTTFYKKLKSLSTMSPVEFVRDMRLKRARQLLDAGENTISEIAYMVGFSSSGYFSTCFKEEYKISPSEYVKSKNNAGSANL